MIFETHAHYEDERFDVDREELLKESLEGPDHLIDVITNVGSTFATSRASVELAHKYDRVYAAIGIHPSEIKDYGEEVENYLRSNASDDKVVAIGEIGLDYYWDKDESVQAAQREVFRRQLEIARDTGLPIIVHSRDAAKDTMDILKSVSDYGLKGVIHCYSYSVDQAREYVKMGYFIGIGGVVTFKNSKTLKAVAKDIPLDHIVIETDCPYMAPTPHRGERNCSLYLTHVVDEIAAIKGMSSEEVMEITRENAYRLYPKVKRV